MNQRISQAAVIVLLFLTNDIYGADAVYNPSPTMAQIAQAHLETAGGPDLIQLMEATTATESVYPGNSKCTQRDRRDFLNSDLANQILSNYPSAVRRRNNRMIENRSAVPYVVFMRCEGNFYSAELGREIPAITFDFWIHIGNGSGNAGAETVVWIHLNDWMRASSIDKAVIEERFMTEKYNSIFYESVAHSFLIDRPRDTGYSTREIDTRVYDDDRSKVTWSNLRAGYSITKQLRKRISDTVTPEQTTFRFNLGGPSYVDPMGNTWATDQKIVTYGDAIALSARDVLNTELDPMYLTARTGSSVQVRIPVADHLRAYKVRTHFFEPEYEQAGRRVAFFSGPSWYTGNLDVFARAGARNTAWIEESVVYPPFGYDETSGKIVITASKTFNSVGLPMISGVEVLPLY